MYISDEANTDVPTPQQQTKKFTVNLLPLSTVSLETIDLWLVSVFDINLEPYFQGPFISQNSISQHHYELAWRGLHLVNTFLQFANVPSFYASRDIQVKQAKDPKSHITIAIPVVFIDGLSQKAYEIAVRSAFEVLLWLSQKELNLQNTQQLYRIVERKGRGPLRRYYKGGKSTLPILNAAYKKDIPFLHLGDGVYQLGWGCNARHVSRSTTELDSAIGAKTAQDKSKSAVLLKTAGLPAPEHISVNTQKAAITAANELGWPVVVKPSNCDRGEGVTVGINNNEQLSSAFDVARKFSKRRPILVEQEVAGVCHRLFITDGDLLYAIKRRPLSVIGNGKDTVDELISNCQSRESSKAPWLRSYRYLNDTFAEQTMAAKGFSINSIPTDGELVPLRPFQSDEWGGTPEDVTSMVHPENISIAVRAAKVFGLYNAGIDIISPDISRPWHENGAIINEVNFSPLFGGTDISKEYVPHFLDKFITGDGRIPIDVFIGSEVAYELALIRHRELLKTGKKSCLTSHNSTLYLSENEMSMPFDTLSKRCLAVLTDRQIDSLVIVVQTDESLYQGVPVDQINSLKMVGGTLLSWKNGQISLPDDVKEKVNDFFKRSLKVEQGV